jgi:hypothetical protein
MDASSSFKFNSISSPFLYFFVLVISFFMVDGGCLSISVAILEVLIFMEEK